MLLELLENYLKHVQPLRSEVGQEEYTGIYASSRNFRILMVETVDECGVDIRLVSLVEKLD